VINAYETPGKLHYSLPDNEGEKRRIVLSIRPINMPSLNVCARCSRAGADRESDGNLLVCHLWMNVKTSIQAFVAVHPLFVLIRLPFVITDYERFLSDARPLFALAEYWPSAVQATISLCRDHYIPSLRYEQVGVPSPPPPDHWLPLTILLSLMTHGMSPTPNPIHPMSLIH